MRFRLPQGPVSEPFAPRSRYQHAGSHEGAGRAGPMGRPMSRARIAVDTIRCVSSAYNKRQVVTHRKAALPGLPTHGFPFLLFSVQTVSVITVLGLLWFALQSLGMPIPIWQNFNAVGLLLIVPCWLIVKEIVRVRGASHLEWIAATLGHLLTILASLLCAGGLASAFNTETAEIGQAASTPILVIWVAGPVGFRDECRAPGPSPCLAFVACVSTPVASASSALYSSRMGPAGRVRYARILWRHAGIGLRMIERVVKTAAFAP